MFFILSKVLSFLITPIVWIVGLLIYSWRTKIESRKRKCFLWALGLLIFFSNSFILDEFMRLWEVPAMKYEEIEEPYDAAIVLGGVLNYDENYSRLQFYRSNDRLLQALELYKRGYVKKILFVGGSGRVTEPEKKEGPLVKRYLSELGLPDDALLFENESRNTRENAVNAKAILDKEIPKGRYLLITSGFHMRRSIACFRKVGIEPVPYSADRYSGPRKYDLDHLLVPNSEALTAWNVLLHEWVGFIMYKLSGYA
jgi:uncharacterized SAM-binding protein YcdF (DUF218 family)